MSEFFLLLLAAAATYSIGRVIVLDDIFAEIRDGIIDRLTMAEFPDGERRPIVRSVDGETMWRTLPLWRQKLATLLTCPHCVTAWVGAASVAVLDVFESVPVPVYFWLATWSIALVLWAVVDSE